MELSTNLASINDIIAKLPQQKIAQTISFLLMIYIAYLAAQVTWLIADKPVMVTKNYAVLNKSASTTKISVNNIQKLNLFGIYNTMPVEEVIAIQDAPETRLNLTLSAAVASDDKSKSAAIIENKGKQETYGIGDTVTGTRATLEQVLNDRVLIKQSGRLETLMLDGFDYKKISAASVTKLQPKSAKKSSPRKINAPISKSPDVVDMRSNRQLSQQARLLKADINQDPGKITDYLRINPKRKNGAIVGYRLSPGKNPEFFKNSGLKAGDVAIEMNGYDLTAPMEAAQALMALKKEKEVSLLVNRKDGTTRILFSIDN
jgi:general secretion pathway protein C